MATIIRSTLALDTTKLQSVLSVGPWNFSNIESFDESFIGEVSFNATTERQIIGGSSPICTYIATIQMLMIVPYDYDIKVGLHGVDASDSGFTVSADRPLYIGHGSLTSLAVYNSGSAANVVVFAIGGV